DHLSYPEQWVHTRSVAWSRALEKASKFRIAAREQQKLRYDAEHDEAREYRENQPVLVYMPHFTRDGKPGATRPWSGPHRVIRRKDVNSYVVLMSYGPDDIHVDRLQPVYRFRLDGVFLDSKSAQLLTDKPAVERATPTAVSLSDTHEPMAFT